MWDNKRGRSASGVAGVTFEKRQGGSAFAHQELETKEADGALFGQMPLGKYILAGAGTLFVQSRTRDFSDRREHERRQSSTIEITLRRPSPRHTWLAGIASEWFANRTPATPMPSAYVYTGPSIFFHDEMQVASWLTASGSVRVDHHVSDGVFVSPRGSALVHSGPWSARISGRPELLVPETAHRGDGSGGPGAPDDRQRRRSRARNREQRVGRRDPHDPEICLVDHFVSKPGEQSRADRPRDVYASATNPTPSSRAVSRSSARRGSRRSQ